MVDSDLQELVDKYQPNSTVLKAMASIRLLATVGPTASGKTTLMKALVAKSPEFDFVLDETSRRPRVGEKSGQDLLFRSQDEIINDAKNGELVQIAIGPNGDLYSTRLYNYPSGKTGILALVPAAIRQFRTMPIESLKCAFVVPATYELWQQWLSKQSKNSDWSEQQLKARLEEAKSSYEFAFSDTDISFILNDDTSSAVERLLQVANGQVPDKEEEAKAAAASNYRHLIAQNNQ